MQQWHTGCNTINHNLRQVIFQNLIKLQVTSFFDILYLEADHQTVMLRKDELSYCILLI